MISTIFSFMMALLWCDIFIVATYLMMRKNSFVVYVSIYSILSLIVISLIRLLLGFETGFAYVIRSYKIFPAIADFFTSEPLRYISDSWTINILEICIIVWITVSIILVIKLFAGIVRFREDIEGERTADDERIYDILNDLSGGKAYKIHVIMTPYLSTPIISGYFKPTIYLPDIEFSDSELYYALLHEYTHYLHKDLWVKLLVEIICAVYWWNPLIYLLKYNIDNSLEIKSDLNLSAGMTKDEKAEYLRSILSIVEKVRAKELEYAHKIYKDRYGLELVNMNGDRPVNHRFYYVLESGKNIKPKKLRVAIFYTTMIAMFVVSYLFVIQPARMPEGYREEYNDNNMFVLDPGNSYIVQDADGRYSLYINDEYVANINDITASVFSSLKIYKQEDLK